MVLWLSGMPVARNMLNNTGANNKAILMFQDTDDKFSKAAIDPILNENIKLYLIVCGATRGMDRYEPYGKITYAGKYEYSKVLECFEEMFGEISNDFRIKSNKVSTTVTSGLKGYQYAVTTSSTHTFTNEEIVGIEEIPTYISGEQQMVQYLHIRAIDNSGNASETRSILLQVPAKITLKSEYTYGENEVPLSWTINDPREGYKYRVYQKEENQEKFTLIATNNSVETITKNETKQDRYTTPGTYTWTVPQGVTEIKVIVASAGEMGEESLFGEYSSKENEETNGEENGETNEETNGEENEEIKEEIKEYTLQVNENEEYQVKIGKRRK